MSPLLIAVFFLFGCDAQPDSDLESDSFSTEMIFVPKIAAKLKERRVLGEEGLLRIYLYDAKNIKTELNADELPNHGKNVETWLWEETPMFHLMPDGIRDKLKEAARKNPPDGRIMPGRLSHFLIEVYQATK